MTVRHVLYWDIDGTLLTTARAGVPALEDGAEVVLGRRPDLSGMTTAGLTDRMIARRILADAGSDPSDDDAVQTLLDGYGAALPARLAARRGRVLPGVVETLDELAARGDVANMLVTGIFGVGAAAKLSSYGMDQYFVGGGFSEDGEDRADIARAAIRRARAEFGGPALTGVLIGDTPYDVRAGRAVGLRVVAVASDPAGRGSLEESDPWWLLDGVPTATDLLDRMSAVSAGPA
jgi:phosphoglycolate phosphatase-like HAD superfamily hydrolase